MAMLEHHRTQKCEVSQMHFRAHRLIYRQYNSFSIYSAKYSIKLGPADMKEREKERDRRIRDKKSVIEANYIEAKLLK